MSTATATYRRRNRIYEPVQDPTSQQGFNRYAYCLNNPLKYVDPSGEVFVLDDILFAAAIGAFFNTAANLVCGNVNSMGDSFASVGVGALAGAAGAFAGGAVFSAMPCGGFLGGAASGSAAYSTSNFIIGLGNSLIQKNTVGKSFETAGIAWLEGLATGAVLGGLAMGLNSLDYGGNFWNGIITNDYLADGVVMYEHPNIRNFSGYDDNIAMEDNALIRKIDWTYGSDVIGEFGLNVTTNAPDGFSIDPMTGVYVNGKGEQIFGRVVHNPHVGSSNMYISPYAATHHDPTMFRAVTGHELTHAYHYHARLAANACSEFAAQAYSYMEYYMAGYSDMCSTANLSGYTSNYYVPAEYRFSTIEFYKWLYSK